MLKKKVFLCSFNLKNKFKLVINIERKKTKKEKKNRVKEYVHVAERLLGKESFRLQVVPSVFD